MPPKAGQTTAGSLLNINDLQSPDNLKQPARKTVLSIAANNLPVNLEGLNSNLSGNLGDNLTAFPKIVTSLPAATTFNESLNSMLATFPPFDTRDISPSLHGLPFGQHLKLDHKDSAYYLIPTGQLTGQLAGKSVPIIDQFSFTKDLSSPLQPSRADPEIIQLVIAFESLTVQLEKKITRPTILDSTIKEQ